MNLFVNEYVLLLLHSELNLKKKLWLETLFYIPSKKRTILCSEIVSKENDAVFFNVKLVKRDTRERRRVEIFPEHEREVKTWKRFKRNMNKIGLERYNSLTSMLTLVSIYKVYFQYIEQTFIKIFS